MNCEVCGKPCELIEHIFYVGTCPKSLTRAEGPEKLHSFLAPLYFRAGDPTWLVVADFCSAECSLKWMKIHGRY